MCLQRTLFNLSQCWYTWTKNCQSLTVNHIRTHAIFSRKWDKEKVKVSLIFKKANYLSILSWEYKNTHAIILNRSSHTHMATYTSRETCAHIRYMSLLKPIRETYLQDLLIILKRILENYKEILKTYFLRGTNTHTYTHTHTYRRY